MRKPNFICLGAQKAGTTTLHDILKQHPDIYLPKDKEAPFFSIDDSHNKGVDWWMNEYFSDYNGEKILGVMTPEYLYYKEVPQRIFNECDPGIKLIIILRQPVSRAYSHYLMSKRRGFEHLSFEEAINQEPERILKGEFERNHFSYIGRSKYIEQIKRYQQLFNKDNILYLCFETDIINNIDVTIQRIESFLGVERVKLNTQLKSNPASEMRSEKVQQLFVKQSPIKTFFKTFTPSKLRRWLRRKIIGLNQKELANQNRLSEEKKKEYFVDFFQSDIHELESLTGLNLNHWKPQ